MFFQGKGFGCIYMLLILIDDYYEDGQAIETENLLP